MFIHVLCQSVYGWVSPGEVVPFTDPICDTCVQEPMIRYSGILARQIQVWGQAHFQLPAITHSIPDLRLTLCLSLCEASLFHININKEESEKPCWEFYLCTVKWLLISSRTRRWSARDFVFVVVDCCPHFWPRPGFRGGGGIHSFAWGPPVDRTRTPARAILHSHCDRSTTLHPVYFVHTSPEMRIFSRLWPHIQYTRHECRKNVMAYLFHDTVLLYPFWTFE